MLADEDHPLEDDATTSTLTARPEPQVMVVYRRQGVPWVLVPPLLLIAAVVGIIGYRKSAPPVRPILMAQAPPAVPVETPAPIVAPVAAAPIIAAPVVPVVAPTPTPPAVVPTEPPPAPATTPQPAPVVEPAPIVAEEPVKRDAVGFDPDAAKVAVAPIPADGPPLRDGRPPDGPAPNPEAVRSVFQDEAEARHAERLRLEAAKPGLLEGDPRNTRARRQSIVAEARRDADRDRAAFHANLRRLVADKGYQAGRDIRDLYDTYGGREATIPEIQIPMARDLIGPSSRLSTQARIERMRRWGQPEHLILEDLQVREADNRNGRNGPRTVDQSWVFAARILLAYPPTRPATVAKPVGSAPAPR